MIQRRWRGISWQGLIALGMLALLASAAVAQPPALVQQAELIPPDLGATDGYGRVVISGDGSTAFISALGGACAGGANCGAVYVFSRRHGSWIQEARLTASDGAANDAFAVSVATTFEGETVLIGAFNNSCAEGLNCGAVYAFERQADATWVQQQKITPADLNAFDHFGVAVAVSGDGATALIGAHGADCEAGVECGAVYVLSRNGSGWAVVDKIVKGISSIAFGAVISMTRDGTAALIDANHFGVTTGEIYFLRKLGGQWVEEARIDPPAGCFEFFGAVDISDDGNTALIEAHEPCRPVPHHGFVYTREGGTWSPQAEFLASEGPVPDSMALSGDGNLALVGVQGSDCTSPGAGDGTIAYLFSRVGASWSQRQNLTLLDPGLSDFGSSVDLSSSGSTALVGTSFRCPFSQSDVAFAFASAAFSPDVPTLNGFGLLALAAVLAACGIVVLLARR